MADRVEKGKGTLGETPIAYDVLRACQVSSQRAGCLVTANISQAPRDETFGASYEEGAKGL